jgi:hypothetical protein
MYRASYHAGAPDHQLIARDGLEILQGGRCGGTQQHERPVSKKRKLMGGILRRGPGPPPNPEEVEPPPSL